jgi:zinc/manganese transport system substrate-binding protein
VKAAAFEAGVPVVPVTETMPPGLHYLDWMSQNLDAIEAALS